MLAGAFADGIVVFLIPLLLAEFTKTDLSAEAFRKLVPYLIACFAASVLCQWFLRKDGEALGKEFGNYLRLKYFKIISHLDVMTLRSHHSGYLLSLVTKICDSSTGILFLFTWLVAHSIATLSLFFFFTARESVVIAVINSLILVLFLFVSLILSRKIVPIFSALNLKHAELTARYVDLMANISTVKKLGLFQFAERQIAQRVDQNSLLIRRLQTFHANRWFLLHTIYGCAFLSTISFLLFRITHGVSSASILILFISAYSIIRSQVERLSELVKDLLELNAYTASLSAILNSSRRSSGSKRLEDWKKIELHEIEFTYPTAQRKIVIPDFSLTKGELTCVTGESGQGKSTLLGILGGFFDVTRGRRLVDGEPYETFSSDALTQLFSLVSQDVELFDLSVRSNLCLGENVADDDILQMLNTLNLGPWYEQLPNGLDTVVGEKGFTLSAGERQRINIARGFLLNRDILLFDEPTSHLDDATEAVVVDFLRDRLQGKSAVFVTHRPAILKLCGRHYQFANGVLQRA